MSEIVPSFLAGEACHRPPNLTPLGPQSSPGALDCEYHQISTVGHHARKSPVADHFRARRDDHFDHAVVLGDQGALRTAHPFP